MGVRHHSAFRSRCIGSLNKKAMREGGAEMRGQQVPQVPAVYCMSAQSNSIGEGRRIVQHISEVSTLVHLYQRPIEDLHVVECLE